MVALTAPPPSSISANLDQANAFSSLFPHRFDYIYAPYPEAGTTPNWQTETRHPLTERLLQQSSYLYGVRFGAKTQYCLLDIDKGSRYHPQSDPLAIGRILAALEAIGLVSYLACTSSYSGGLHLYLPFDSAQRSWQIGTAITVLLENAGFTVKPGQLEVFPNRRNFSVHSKPSLFNAHRLPLQIGSYLLNRDFAPIWGDQQSFVQQWRLVQDQNQISAKLLTQIIKQTQRQQYQVSGKAAKFLNDLNAEIEPGWTDRGQTNYLLGRITMRTYIFHHILEAEAPLTGAALVAEIVRIARSLPGYQDWCQHQHEIEHRATEWASCIENSRYFAYGDSKRNPIKEKSDLNKPNWNQQQSNQARERIRQAIANLLEQNALPAQATARFKALTSSGIGGGSLYRHKDLWHPEFLASTESTLKFDLETTKQTALDESNKTTDETIRDTARSDLEPLPYSTNLLPAPDGNLSSDKASSDQAEAAIQQTGGNTLIDRHQLNAAVIRSCDAAGWVDLLDSQNAANSQRFLKPP